METIVEHALKIGFTSLVDGPAGSFGEKDGLAARESPAEGTNLYVTSLPEEATRSVNAPSSKAELGGRGSETPQAAKAHAVRDDRVSRNHRRTRPLGGIFVNVAFLERRNVGGSIEGSTVYLDQELGDDRGQK